MKTSKPKPPKYLPKYDLVIFIDDTRIPQSVLSLPKYDNLIFVKGFHELDDTLSSPDFKHVKIAFISFDHYLDTDQGRFNGNDCLFLCKEYDIADHIDVQGHSSDPDKNIEKLNWWYRPYDH